MSHSLPQTLALTGVALAALALPAMVAAQQKAPTKPEALKERRSSLVQRAKRVNERLEVPSDLARGIPFTPAQFPLEFRAIDNLNNNPIDPTRGATGNEHLRLAPNAYADGVSAPARPDGPNPRTVSNVIHSQDELTPNEDRASDYLWQWGQFLDHDINETPFAAPREIFDLEIPAGDPWFDPFGSGAASLPIDRSGYNIVDGVREQVNVITSYIDASNVYGSEHEREHFLRTNDGTGRLKMDENGLLPLNVEGLPNAEDVLPGAPPQTFDVFIAGDARVNEQIALTAMHTLWVREHNYWADRIRDLRPNLSGDGVYQRARAIVAAEMQVITYNEFLPLLLGENALPAYEGYDPTVDASIANEFTTAAYRVGHTMLSPEILLLDGNLEPTERGSIALRDMFFTNDTFREIGLDPILRGLARKRAQTIDHLVIDDVRNFLFGPPGAGGFDLVSLNLQRARDHGIASYNDIRQAYGLPRAQTFLDINPDPQVALRFASVYASIDDVDPWSGMIAEPHVDDALVGQTLRTVLADQFTRLRDGDRFWYQSYLPRNLRNLVERQSLAKVIRRNTGIGDELQDDAFRVPEEGAACVGDLDGNGVVNFFDFVVFAAAYGTGDALADLNGDGAVDPADFLAFVTAYFEGC
jgi:peroxidase